MHDALIGDAIDDRLRLAERRRRESLVARGNRLFHLLDGRTQFGFLAGVSLTRRFRLPGALAGLRRVGRLANGWLNNITSPEVYRECLDKIRTYAADAGRDPLSIEPGLYRPGKWGVRIENLVLNVPAAIGGDEPTAFGEFLEFETLTLCPIDIRCIERELLRADEIEWLNGYHATVRARLAPLVSGGALAWLLLRTAPI